MTLSERINGVMDEVKALEADQKHQQGYGYISANKILSRIGQAMVNNGLAIIPACLQHTTNLHTYTDSYGKEKMLWQVDAQMQMTITDNESEPMAVLWTGSGVDYASPDKALYKAMTSGHKYFIMKLFMVGVGNEDGEHEQREEISGRNVTTNPARARQNGNGSAGKTAVTNTQQKPSEQQMKQFHALGSEVYGPDWPEKRGELISYITEGRSDSSKHLTLDEWQRLVDGMEKKLA